MACARAAWRDIIMHVPSYTLRETLGAHGGPFKINNYCLADNCAPFKVVCAK